MRIIELVFDFLCSHLKAAAQIVNYKRKSLIKLALGLLSAAHAENESKKH